MKPQVLVALLLAAAGPAAAAPCGGLSLAGGMVRSGTPLPATAELGGLGDCLHAVADQLQALPGLRTVTITVKVPSPARVDGTGKAVLASYTRELVDAGLAEARMSGVVAAGTGEVFVTYSQRSRGHDVGAIEGATGPVSLEWEGISRGAVAGDALSVGSWVVTGEGGSAMLALADKSRVRVNPRSRVKLGALHLDDDLERVVDLEVEAGGIDVAVARGGEGSSFRVNTRYGAAGVRGTVFRVSITEGRPMHLETLEGSVELSGKGGAVVVDGLWGSELAADGVPVEPVKLPKAPRSKTPREGTLPPEGLRWASVGKAMGYVVEVAADAEFGVAVSTASLGPTARMWQPDLVPGRWFWRVAATETEGYTGPWSKVYAFDVDGH